jgi:transposase
MTKHFKPEFRQEVAELVVDKGYSVREAADAMGVGKSTVDTCSGQVNLYNSIGFYTASAAMGGR